MDDSAQNNQPQSSTPAASAPPTAPAAGSLPAAPSVTPATSPAPATPSVAPAASSPAPMETPAPVTMPTTASPAPAQETPPAPAQPSSGGGVGFPEAPKLETTPAPATTPTAVTPPTPSTPPMPEATISTDMSPTDTEPATTPVPQVSPPVSGLDDHGVAMPGGSGMGSGMGVPMGEGAIIGPDSGSAPPQMSMEGSEGGGTPKIVKILGVIVMAIVIIGGFALGGYLLGNSSFISSGKPSPSPEETLSPLSTSTPEPTATPDPKAGWKTYESTNNTFSIMHPESVKTEEKSTGVVLTLNGPTQKDESDFSDGISLTVDTAVLSGKTLKSIADAKAAKPGSGMTLEGEVGETKVAGLSGYILKLQNQLGSTITYYYLPKGEKNYFVVTDASLDPSESGFADTVNLMLSTLKNTETAPSASPSPSPSATPSAQ